MISSFITFPNDKYDTCGGKGKALIEMSKQGFPIPKGFIINSEEFIEYCDDNHLENTPLSKMKSGIINGIFSIDMQNRITRNFDDLFQEHEYVAVRSSALCEDGYEYAWSGELDTFLYVKKVDLLDRIKECFASLFSERALAYSKRTGIKKKEMQVAVIVQKQIDSEYAGVAFSNDPLTGYNNIIIETVEGQGDSLVSGKVTPDRYIYSYDNELLNAHINAEQFIKDDYLKMIINHVVLLHEFYKIPVDVEWAVYNQELFILQCRPITTIIKDDAIQNTLLRIFPTNKWEFDTQGAFNYMLMRTIMDAANIHIQEKVFGFHRKIEDCLRFNGQIFKSKLAKQYLSEAISRRIEENPDFLINFAQQWEEISKTEKEYVEYISAIDWRNVSTENIIKEVKRFGEMYTYSLVYVYYYIEDYLEKKFHSILKDEDRFSEETRKEIFNNIASCSNDFGKLLYSEEPIDLLKIAIKKQRGYDISNLLTAHEKKYSWMLSPIGREYKVFTRENYEQRINDAIEEGKVADKLNSLMQSKKDNDDVFLNTIDKYRLSSDVVSFAKSIRAFIYYRTLLTERSDWLFFNGRVKILHEIAERIGFDINDIVMLSFDEIVSILQNRLDRDVALKLATSRTENYAIVFLSGELTVFDGQDAIDIENGFVPAFFEERKHELQEKDTSLCIEGTTCYPGRVVGKAVIVNNLLDCNKVQKGDILVANMTTPNFISAMEKAAGFVTNQGGITCHAAILSREMKIPCVVGTSIATKLFHDGDLIEVDSYIGKVRLIS